MSGQQEYGIYTWWTLASYHAVKRMGLEDIALNKKCQIQREKQGLHAHPRLCGWQKVKYGPESGIMSRGKGT